MKWEDDQNPDAMVMSACGTGSIRVIRKSTTEGNENGINCMKAENIVTEELEQSLAA